MASLANNGEGSFSGLPQQSSLGGLSQQSAAYENGEVKELWRELLKERDARNQQVNAIWLKLGDVLAWIRDEKDKTDEQRLGDSKDRSRQQREALTHAKNALAAAPMPVHTEHLGEKALVEIDTLRRSFDMKLNDLEAKINRSTSNQLEDMQDQFGRRMTTKVSALESQLQNQMNENVNEMAKLLHTKMEQQQLSSQTRPAQPFPQKQPEPAPLMSSDVATRIDKLQQAFVKSNTDLESSLTRVQDQVRDQSKDIDEIWAMVDVTLSLSVVRASRIGLRSLDLSPQEREVVLKQLSEKEDGILAQMSQNRQKK